MPSEGDKLVQTKLQDQKSIVKGSNWHLFYLKFTQSTIYFLNRDTSLTFEGSLECPSQTKVGQSEAATAWRSTNAISSLRALQSLTGASKGKDAKTLTAAT